MLCTCLASQRLAPAEDVGLAYAQRSRFFIHEDYRQLGLLTTGGLRCTVSRLVKKSKINRAENCSADCHTPKVLLK